MIDPSQEFPAVDRHQFERILAFDIGNPYRSLLQILILYGRRSELPGDPLILMRKIDLSPLTGDQPAIPNCPPLNIHQAGFRVSHQGEILGIYADF